MSNVDFRVGDIVSFGGVEGVVCERDCQEPYVIACSFKDKMELDFTIDGRFGVEHTEPLLKLVSRPKKMVKKTIERWENVYPSGRVCVHPTREVADDHANDDRIACVKLTGSYEVYE